MEKLLNASLILSAVLSIAVGAQAISELNDGRVAVMVSGFVSSQQASATEELTQEELDKVTAETGGYEIQIEELNQLNQ